MNKLSLKFMVLFLICPCLLWSQQAGREDGFAKAEKYFFQQKFEMAELLLQEELRANPENEKACSYLADIFLARKNYDAALNLYKRALDLNPQSAENHFRLGQIYYQKQLGDMAIEHFAKAFTINPNLKFTQYHIGLSYLMLLRNKQKTIDSWESYLRIAPEDPQYEKIRRVIELLKDPNFVLPPVGSNIPIEEALHLGGSTLQQTQREDINRTAGHEEKKTEDVIEEIPHTDDDL